MANKEAQQIADNLASLGHLPEFKDDDEDDLGFCCMSLCEWEAIRRVNRPDGTTSDLCAQCYEAYVMGLNDGNFNDK